MNKKINIIKLEQSKDCMGLKIILKDNENKEYHTNLENKEIAQLSKELNEILCYNLYEIKEWINI